MSRHVVLNPIYGEVENIQSKRKYFSQDTDFNRYVILYCLSKTDIPLGSWILKEKLLQMGVNLSLASIGRYLKSTDNQGYTTLIKNQGRKITKFGLKYLKNLEENIKRKKIGSEVEQAATPESKQDIINLLKVRKVIEVEVVKSIINNDVTDGIKMLRESVESHLKCVEEGKDPKDLAIHFHQILSELSCNRFLTSVLNLLIYEELMLEAKFPEIAEKLKDAHHIIDHKRILDAIRKRNLPNAIYHTEKHIDNLINSVIDNKKE